MSLEVGDRVQVIQCPATDRCGVCRGYENRAGTIIRRASYFYVVEFDNHETMSFSAEELELV